MTAKEFIDDKQNKHFSTFGVFADTNSKIADWVGEFARIKGKKILEVAAKKAKTEEKYFPHELGRGSYREVGKVDQDSILNAINLDEFIK
jgi:hypothetical protein